MEQITTNLLIIGGTLSGLSLAIEAKEGGLERVLVIEPCDRVEAPEVIGQHALSVEFLTPVTSLLTAADQRIVVGTNRLTVTADLVAIASRPPRSSRELGFSVAASLSERIHLSPPAIDFRESDVLVVGIGEEAAEYAWWLAGQGAGVVLAFGSADLEALSRLARRQLFRLEAERRATILWNSQPEAIEEMAGFPMVYFGDRRTPDLQFDHVVFRHPAPSRETAVDDWDLDLSEEAPSRVFLVDPWVEATAVPEGVTVTSPGQAWDSIRVKHLPQLPAASGRPRVWRDGDRQQIEELRATNYNATITYFERSHSDLWVLRVKPDHGDTHHLPGQYASLGLGYWEPRIDSARDRGLERSWDKLIRRSYSISSPVLDSTGYLFDPCLSPGLEFYVVLVPPTADRVPALTPRLALKAPGDRIYLGPKVAGRYTLSRVIDPNHRLLFLATGTGEAPHNSMVVDLLRNGHRGPIVSVVSVRHRSDLGYLTQHQEIERNFPNYHYLPLVTRDPDQPKLYVQDFISNGMIEEALGAALDPAHTDIFLCGNPAMIGLPDLGEDGETGFPASVGACQLLVQRGFEIERRGTPGNVHYEEYW